MDEAVKAILADVAARGDEAVVDYTRRFDALDLTPERLRIADAEVEAALAACEAEALEALALAHARIARFHRLQTPSDAL